MAVCDRSVSESTKFTLPIPSFQQFIRLSPSELSAKYCNSFAIGSIIGCESQWNFKMKRDATSFVPSLELANSESNKVVDQLFTFSAAVASDHGIVATYENVFGVWGNCDQLDFNPFLSVANLNSSSATRADLVIKITVEDKCDEKEYRKRKWLGKLSQNCRQQFLNKLEKREQTGTSLTTRRVAGLVTGILPVHDDVVSTRSPNLFQAMQAGRGLQNGVFVMEHITNFGALQVFVHYLYCSEVKSEWKTYYMQLLKTAIQFGIFDLFDFINDNLHEVCNVNNCVELLKVAKDHQLRLSVPKIFQFCCDHVPFFHEIVS